MTEVLYSPDEQRIVDYMTELCGFPFTGKDPIGFIIASHATLRHDVMMLRYYKPITGKNDE